MAVKTERENSKGREICLAGARRGYPGEAAGEEAEASQEVTAG